MLKDPIVGPSRSSLVSQSERSPEQRNSSHHHTSTATPIQSNLQMLLLSLVLCKSRHSRVLLRLLLVTTLFQTFTGTKIRAMRRTAATSSCTKPPRRIHGEASPPSVFEDETQLLVSSSLADSARYDWNLSTEENHQVDCERLYGPFKKIRERLDYGYHVYYSRERQELQDKLIQHLLEENDESCPCSSSSSSPWVVFTAGVMGAGKSFTVHRLYQERLFPLHSFVIVDPDEIRRLLPEFPVYLEKSAPQAGTLTRKEAGMVAEILSLAALERGRNVLQDGSLRDAQWYEHYFSDLRHSFPGIRLGIIHVTAPIDVIYERVKERAIETGRAIPREVLEQAIVEVPRSVNFLKHLVDFFLKIENTTQPGNDGGDYTLEAAVSLASMNDRFQAKCDHDKPTKSVDLSFQRDMGN